jgi:hypothetical protein
MNGDYNAPMRKTLTLILVIFAFAASWGQVPKPDSIPYVPLDSLQRAIDMSLATLKMHRADLTFRGDYLEEDPYRLAAIDNYMKEPLKIIDCAGHALDFKDFSEFQYENLTASDSIKLVKPPSLKKIGPDSLLLTDERVLLGSALSSLIERLMGLAENVDPASWPKYNKYSASQRDSLALGWTLLLEEKVEDEFKSVDELDSIAQYEDKWAEKLVTLSDGCQGRGRIVDEFLAILAMLPANSKIVPPLAQHFSINTDYGEIIVGDSSDNHYVGDIFMIIDPGGNDTYDIRFNGVGHQTYIIDFSGNDTYNLPKNRISPYFFGGNMIVDYSGDDIYNGGSFSIGAGLFGASVLWDKQGNDKYFGDTFTEGAGCFGVGIVRDDEGNDSYQGALYAQGFGFVDGIGILLDSNGNDNYFAGGKYKDILRYKDHYLSLSQGFAYGLRPKMSGGIGMLIDKSGNDSYISDIFGQGCGYWYGLGVLADGSGNDQYVSFQYAQGAATHMALGILYDVSGDDNYTAKGVSQGCGHDRAAGILVDLDGTDNYSAYDLSQAAGSANGIGILADIRGNDAYIVRSDQNTQGFGQPRRDYGSIGIFIDFGGKDGYAGGIGHDSSWWSDSKWGVGIDK